MSDVNLATKSDLASLFQELEDAARHAKKENKENEIKTESQVKELDSFLTSVKKVVNVIEKKNDDTPIEPKKITPKIEKKSKPNGKIQEQSKPVETKSLSTEDETKLGAFGNLMSSFGVILDAPPEIEDTDALKLQVKDIYPQVITQEEEDTKLKAIQNLFSNLVEAPRIPRKKGQPAGSDSHSDLYTDENPKGTIQGLGFKDVETARASVKKIEGSSKTHAHKVQAAVAMEQRAKEMGKTAEAAIYRSYIEKMKKKTKEMQKEEVVTPNLVTAVKNTPLDITQALTEVKQRALPTKEETVEATQELITNVIANLDDMKSKTEVKEQLSEIDTIRNEFNTLRQQVRQSQITIGGLSGSGGGLDPNKIANHMIPAANNTFDLGSPSRQWRNLYLGSGDVTSSPSISFEGKTSDAFETILSVVDPTADRVVSIQDKTGTIELISGFLLSGTDGSSTNSGDFIVLDTSADENGRLLYEDGTSDPISVLASHGITLSGQGWNAFQFDNG
jgi:hypothetical protein